MKPVNLMRGVYSAFDGTVGMGHVPHSGGCCHPSVAQAISAQVELFAISETAASATLPMPPGITLDKADPDRLPEPFGSIRVNPTWMPQERQARRVACDECRQRKLRCGRALGGHTPSNQACSNCVERNLQCTEQRAQKGRKFRGKRSFEELLPTSCDGMPPAMYAQTPACFPYPRFSPNEDSLPLSYAAPPRAWMMLGSGMPLDPNPAYAMQPCYPRQQQYPDHAQQCAGGSVSRPSLHGLAAPPVPQAPAMPPQGAPMHHQTAMPPQGGAMYHQRVMLPLQAPLMHQQAPGAPVLEQSMPWHPGVVGRQAATPMHMTPPLGAPGTPPSYPGHATPSCVLMPPHFNGAHPPYQNAR